MDRSTLGRKTFEESFDGWPIWTPDGTRLTFSATASRDLYWQPVDGSEEAQPLLEREHRQYPVSWSPDGTALTYMELHPDTRSDIWVLSFPDRTPSPFVATPADERGPMFSPDGRWIAYTSDESGQDEVYVQPYPGPGSKGMVSTAGGDEPVWSVDGRELFYRSGDQMMAVSVETEPTFSVGTPQILFEGPYERGVYSNPSYDVSPDGERFVMIRSNRDPTRTQLTVVLDWFDELQRLVPTP